MSSYARQPVARSSSGFTVSGQSVTLASLVSFPAMASGAGGTVTYFGVGVGSSGSTELDFFGTVTPNLSVVAGITPQLNTSTAITHSNSDGMSNAAGDNFLLLFFNNTAWANVGNSGGLQPSGAAGSLYLSLHTSSPAQSGNQSTNEISYS